MKLSELEIIRRIRETFPGGAELTDDCGALPPPPPGQQLLVTTDLMEEGQHFRLDWHPPALLGRKLLMVNLSDLDASGATRHRLHPHPGPGPGPGPALAGRLPGRPGGARPGRPGCRCIGGDTVGRASGLGLGITAFGTARRWLRRDAVVPGDRLFVDQELGASLRGLRKLMAGQRWDPHRPGSGPGGPPGPQPEPRPGPAAGRDPRGARLHRHLRRAQPGPAQPGPGRGAQRGPGPRPRAGQPSKAARTTRAASRPPCPGRSCSGSWASPSYRWGWPWSERRRRFSTMMEGGCGPIRTAASITSPTLTAWSNPEP